MSAQLKSDEPLRRALYALPVPGVGSDFDAHILAALSAPAPWWMNWKQILLPNLTAAAFSLSVMLVLIPRLTNAPEGPVQPMLTPSPPQVVASAPLDTQQIDALLMSHASRARIQAALLSQMDAPLPPAPPRTEPRPQRRASVPVTAIVA